MSTPDDTARFERVDWNEIHRSSRIVSAERAALLLGTLLVVALFLYDAFIAHVYLVGQWNVIPVDWAFMLGLVVLFAYGVIPVMRRRDAVRRLAADLRSRPGALLAAAFLVAFVVVGIVGPLVIGTPKLKFHYRFHTRCPELIQPNDVDLPRECWQSVAAFRLTLAAGELPDALSADASASSMDAETVRDAFDLPAEIPDEAVESGVSEAIDALVAGRPSEARERLAETIQSVCEREQPGSNQRNGRPVRCHRYDPAIEAEPLPWS